MQRRPFIRTLVRTFTRLAALSVFSLSQPVFAQEQTILNVSYDVMRDFYKDLNPAFLKDWKEKGGGPLNIQMSHGGSGKQARSVVDGLEADVITMNLASDIDILHTKAGLIPADWNKRLPNASVPFTSATVFIVRKGNPKGVKDWGDLIKPDLKLVIPNPKTAGNGRYTYLNAWAYALKQNKNSEAKAKEFVSAIFKNVPVLDTGGRAATTTFMQRQIGDVLITFENEAEMIAREFGRGQFEVVYPSLSVQVEPPVAVVDKVVDKKGTRKVAQAYLEFLYTPAGQEIAAQNYLRPRNPDVLKKYSAQFPKLTFFTVDEVFGGWQKAQKTHFDDGGSFDQIYVSK